MQTTLHAAIVMDGNGRWAESRQLPRAHGHQAGAEALRRIVETAPNLGIQTLTVYAFSSDNWKRPAAEVESLMLLLALYLDSETQPCVSNQVRITAIGRRDRLAPNLLRSIEQTEAVTGKGQHLHLRLAIDYSGRDAILRDEIGPPVDLLIRTGGEQRLSDFLLWESAYAELFFTPILWPDFDPTDLARLLRDFRRRTRRFGALPPPQSVLRHTERWLA